METVLLGIFFLLNTGVYASEYSFNSEIRHFAVGDGKVYVVTDSELFQMRSDLSVEKRKEISNYTHLNSVTLLVPFDSNKTLVICGTSACGYCEVLNLSDITQTIYRENVAVGPGQNQSSVAFLVSFEMGDEKGSYMLVGKANEEKLINKDGQECTTDQYDVGVTLLSTLHSQPGEIFSKIDSVPGNPKIDIDKDANVEWVDGFQTSSRRHSYLFGNIKSKAGSSKPTTFLLRMDNSIRKSVMIGSLKTAKLQCCNDKQRQKLVASAVISSDSSLEWVGVFSAQEEGDPANTAVAIYKISNRNLTSMKPNINYQQLCSKQECFLTSNAVVFKHHSLTAVAAKKRGNMTELYIGTANGQLMKLVLDETLKPGCVTVLYQSDDNRKVFSRMYFSSEDHEYIYIALKNQIRKVATTQCGTYSTLKNCIGSMDPFCGWCVVTNKCSVIDNCSNSSWISMLKDSLQHDLISFQQTMLLGKVILDAHLSLKGTQSPPLMCKFKSGSKDLCNATVVFPNCSCTFTHQHPSPDGHTITMTVTIGAQTLTESLTLASCPHINNTSPYVRCGACILAGCHWNTTNQSCSWTPESASPHTPVEQTCTETLSERNYVPEIHSLWPKEVSFPGKNNAVIKGKNLELATKVRFQGFIDCSIKEAPVLARTNDTLKFHIPSGNKETVTVCLVTADGRCESNATVTYGSLPTCTELQPGITWASGKRKIQVLGSNLEYVDAVIVQSSSKEIRLSSDKTFWFHTHAQADYNVSGPYNVSLMVANSALLVCEGQLSYQPDPEFTSFSTINVGSDVTVTIQKKEDRLNISTEELKVLGLQNEKEYECVITNVKSSAVICRISGNEKGEINVDSIRIVLGNISKELLKTDQSVYWYALIAIIILLLIGVLVGVFIHRKREWQITAKMNDRLELLESEIRNEIRQGFVDLQTENSDLVENVGAIPYLDYKHFALKVFFPEGGPIASSVMKDVSQDSVKAQMEERYQAFSALIRDQTFLTCFVHALEEQSSFGIKEKCTVASLLTVALQSDLPYLTQVMEELLHNLMDHPSNAHPKLLLRRTESIVEKLLTNWMSICLYGFLRESVGKPLFLLVSALTQQISKGPVDAVTGRALYTLNEDWLLWQAQEFSPLKLKVMFAVGTEGEVSEPLEVSTLTCDTIEQVKEKILQTFQRKFGFRYTQQLREIDIEYEKEGCYVPLEEVDGSSDVQGNVTMMNTLTHYQIPDGASIKVITKKVHAPLSKQTSLRDDQNFSVKYYHLIDPDIDSDQSKHPERKKLKLKEIYLTKLLSTKVAVHSSVENLFQSIWGMPNNKAPLAVKYFFDFLDVQAEKKKVTDPDVLHIWKTNSVPLRFWVNILKNPNFVFSDLEKTPHVDACLSVIAQAFMDSFSLSDQQLGKHAPTNKLLYAKDIPKYKQEVKTYYKLVRDQQTVSSQEFKAFLLEESKKHENDFNESAALQELYKYILLYFNQIVQKLEQNDDNGTLLEKMNHVKDLFESMKRSAWI